MEGMDLSDYVPRNQKADNSFKGHIYMHGNEAGSGTIHDIDWLEGSWQYRWEDNEILGKDQIIMSMGVDAIDFRYNLKDTNGNYIYNKQKYPIIRGIADGSTDECAATKKYVDERSIITIKDGDDFNDFKTPGIYNYMAPMVGENGLLNAPSGSTPSGPAIVIVSKIRNESGLCQSIYDLYMYGYGWENNYNVSFTVACREYDIQNNTWTEWISMNLH